MTDYFDPNEYGDDYFPPDRGDDLNTGWYYDDNGEERMLPDDLPDFWNLDDDLVTFTSNWDERMTEAFSLLTDISEVEPEHIRGQQFQSILEAYEWLSALHLTGFSRIFLVPGSDMNGEYKYQSEVGES